MQDYNNDTYKELEILMKNIEYIRKKNGLSKKEMATILGIGINTLEKIENGIIPKRLTVEIVYRIHKNFRILPSQQFKPLKK